MDDVDYCQQQHHNNSWPIRTTIQQWVVATTLHRGSKQALLYNLTWPNPFLLPFSVLELSFKDDYNNGNKDPASNDRLLIPLQQKSWTSPKKLGRETIKYKNCHPGTRVGALVRCQAGRGSNRLSWRRYPYNYSNELYIYQQKWNLCFRWSFKSLSMLN